MTQDSWGLIIVAAISLAGIVYTQRGIKRTSERNAGLEDRKVSQDAYDRARAADSETIRSLRDEVARERQLRADDQAADQREKDQVQKEIDRLQRQVDVLRQDLSSSSRENLRLTEHIDALERTVARLRARLVTAGLMDDRRPEETT
jgi:predicted  nucleic acid-binding Zn-ribbon protein